MLGNSYARVYKVIDYIGHLSITVNALTPRYQTPGK